MRPQYIPSIPAPRVSPPTRLCCIAAPKFTYNVYYHLRGTLPSALAHTHAYLNAHQHEKIEDQETNTIWGCEPDSRPSSPDGDGDARGLGGLSYESSAVMWGVNERLVRWGKAGEHTRMVGRRLGCHGDAYSNVQVLTWTKRTRPMMILLPPAILHTSCLHTKVLYLLLSSCDLHCRNEKIWPCGGGNDFWFFPDFLLLKKHINGIRSNFHCVLTETRYGSKSWCRMSIKEHRESFETWEARFRD